MAKKLKSYTKLVKEILEANVDARNNDDYLYYLVCKRVNEICIHLPFSEVVLNRKKYGYPPTESIRRSRQKVQEIHPHLASRRAVRKHREINERIFRDYARKKA